MNGTTKYIKEYKRLPSLFADGTVFCAFDTETTGLHSQLDRVIEIGAVKFSVQIADEPAENVPFRVTVLEQFDQLINPEILLPAICSEISHITDDMVRDMPLMQSVLPAFLRFVSGTVLVAHNAPFDIKFMNAELARAELPPLANTVLDTLRFSRAVLPENGHWNLQFLANQFGIDVHAAHRASDDARVCMELLMHLLQVHEQKTAATKNLAAAAL